MAQNRPGRGWHGDSAGHAKAGRQGGKARASKIIPEKTKQQKTGNSK